MVLPPHENGRTLSTLQADLITKYGAWIAYHVNLLDHSNYRIMRIDNDWQKRRETFASGRR